MELLCNGDDAPSEAQLVDAMQHVVIIRTYMEVWPKVDTQTGAPRPQNEIEALDALRDTAYNNAAALRQLSETSAIAGIAKASDYFSERAMAGTGDAVCMVRTFTFQSKESRSKPNQPVR